MLDDDWNMLQDYVCSITPTEFEKYCKNILLGYAEEEKLPNFTITHDTKHRTHDGTYQIDLYATFTAMSVEFKVLCECKQYKNRVNREKVVVLADKVKSLGAHKGMLLSTSDFQSGAVQYAKEHGIALIIVDDYHFEYLSHSSGQPENDEEDPFLYAEKRMPPYVAFDCTTNTDEPRKVYPTRSMIKELLIQQTEKIKELMGIDINLELPEG